MGNLPKPSYTVGGACGGSGWEEKVPLLLPQAKKVPRSMKEKLPTAKAGDDALAALVECWLAFSRKIKPKISKALLDLASFKLGREQLFAFLVRGIQDRAFLGECSVNRSQSPARLVRHTDQGWITFLWQFLACVFFCWIVDSCLLNLKIRWGNGRRKMRGKYFSFFLLFCLPYIDSLFSVWSFNSQMNLVRIAHP